MFYLCVFCVFVNVLFLFVRVVCTFFMFFAFATNQLVVRGRARSTRGWRVNVSFPPVLVFACCAFDFAVFFFVVVAFDFAVFVFVGVVFVFAVFFLLVFFVVFFA